MCDFIDSQFPTNKMITRSFHFDMRTIMTKLRTFLFLFLFIFIPSTEIKCVTRLFNFSFAAKNFVEEIFDSHSSFSRSGQNQRILNVKINFEAWINRFIKADRTIYDSLSGIYCHDLCRQLWDYIQLYKFKLLGDFLEMNEYVLVATQV